MLFHRGNICSFDVYCMCLVFYQTGVQQLQHGSSSDRMTCELLHLYWHCIGDFCAPFGPERVLYGVRLENIALVSEFIRSVEFEETDIFHYFINFTPVFLALGPFLLYFLVSVPCHLCPVFGGFLHAVKTSFSNHPNSMIFPSSPLLEHFNVFESHYC